MKAMGDEKNGKMGFTSDGGVVVIRVGIVEVIDLDPLSLQLLQFCLQISLGS